MNEENDIVSALNAKRLLNIIVVSLMLLMENVDANIINVAVPSIANEIHTSPLNLKLTITSYLVSLAIFVPISGWVSDKFGTKKVLFLSIFGFTLFSFCCGLSHSLSELVCFRFLQGVAGAFMLPVGRLLLLKVFGKKELVKVFILISFTGALGPLLAPLIGGIILSHLNWSFIFWVNIPIGIFGMVVAHYYIDNYTQTVDDFNWWAFVCLAIFLALTSFVLDTLTYPMLFMTRFLLLVLVLFSLFMYIKIESNAKNHIVDYSLFRIRTFRLCFIGGMIIRIAFAGRGFLLALYYQLSLGLSPIQASYLLAVYALGLFIGRSLVRELLPHFGFRTILLVANILSIITSLMLCFVTKVNLFAVLIILSNSLVSSVVFLLLNTLFFADVPEKQYAGATSIANTMQQLSSSMGVTAIAMVLFLSNRILPSFSYGVFVIAFFFIGATGFVLQLLLLKIRRLDGNNLVNK